MINWNRKSVRQQVSLALVLFLLVQSIVPIGYMPSNIFSGGGWIEICPQQQPDLFRLIPVDHENHHHNHHNHSNSGHDVSVENACDWAKSLSQLELFSPEPAMSLWINPVVTPYRSSFSTLISFQRTHSAIRAPPFSLFS